MPLGEKQGSSASNGDVALNLGSGDAGNDCFGKMVDYGKKGAVIGALLFNYFPVSLVLVAVSSIM